MAEIKCPMCGKPNPAELDVCQFCEARLKPVTDELARSQPPIHPGEEPTEQDTGQLEPVLPQWLRDIRQQARESGETEETAEQAPAEGETPQAEPERPADLLAGLQSQSDEDDEIPDWLANLRGEQEQAASDEPAMEDDDLDALKSMLDEDVPAPQESETSGLPDWISDLGPEEAGQVEVQPDETAEGPAQAEPQPPAASDSDFEWNADFGAESGPQAESTEDDTPFDTDLPAWLQDAEQPGPAPESEDGTPPASEGDLPDWLASLGEEESETLPQQSVEKQESQGTPDGLSPQGEETEDASPQDDFQPAPEGGIPEWASSFDDTGFDDSVSQTGEESSNVDELPDWAAPSQEQPLETAPEQQGSQSDAEIEIPDWVSSLGGAEAEDDSAQTSDAPDWMTTPGEDSSEIASQESAQTASEADLPDWLSSLGDGEPAQVEDEPSPSAKPIEPTQPFREEEMPDWLSSFGSEEALQEDERPTPAESAETAQSVAEDETPDWLSSIGEDTTETEQPVEPLEASAVEGTDESEQGTPFVDDEDQPISAEDMESIFSMDMPDWLSGVEGESEAEVAPSTEDVSEDDLDPADLPEWVQAMRPVESVISETEEGTEEQVVEEEGPLAGLRGVLPAVPGIGPSSTPKAYSIKLLASQEQQANATMLEQMLAEEEYPKPISEQKAVGSQWLLRWIITVLLLLVVGGTIFGGTQTNQMPTSAPPETSAVLTYVQSTLPTDAPVLLIFDYEAALAGELEPAAAPLIDYMLTLKHPRFSYISSSPMGSGLAERFMTTMLGSHNYERNRQFVNLGFLPGGAAGVLAFAENPVSTKPLTTTGINAWETSVLQGVSNLSDFSAIILLTNEIETARIWIEQTEMTRGEARLLVVSSAQSGPMIQPYYESGQVDGLVTGLDGGAPIEQVNSGRPGIVRRYWDAYGFGILTAGALIVLGSLWSLFSGWQARRRKQGEE